MAVLWLCHFISYAQNPPETSTLRIQEAIDEITLDGELNENSWLEADLANGFYQVFPIDNIPAEEKTEVKLTYDDKFLYIGAICYTEDPDYMVESLRRDFSFGRNDVFAVYIDPYNDRSNGFSFQTTPYNVQREGIVTLGGEVADNWDNKWYSEVTRHEDRYVIEMAIPFKSFRYNSQEFWNINFLRNQPNRNQTSTWIAVPVQYSPSDLVYTGRLIWDKNPSRSKTNITVIPYAIAQTVKNYENNEPSEQKLNAGLDAKIGISPSLNLDLTVNPDFSQVEVDQQVNNLGRFEIFFPERRQFFLENQDLFAKNGFPNSRPFFSRRIGIIGSGASARQIPIIAGGRLSGKIGKDWRIGLLNMQTDRDKIINDDEELETYNAQNYTVGVVQRQIFARSNIGLLMVNRSATNFDPNDTTAVFEKYNRVIGVDYNLATENNTWEGNVFYHQSINPEKENKDFASGTFLAYRKRNFSIGYFQTLIGDNYKADVGFVPRTGAFNFGGFTELRLFPESNPKIIRHSPGLNYSITTNSNFEVLDKSINLGYELYFTNTSRINANYNWQYVTLTGTFAPNGVEADSLLEGTIHKFGRFGLSYQSDRRKVFNWEFGITEGKFYNGNRTNGSLELNYRFQPIFKSGLIVDYNYIRFHNTFKNVEYLLIGTRIDLTLTNKLFLTSFLQYNDRADNFNINARVQWRFKPVSDIFLVYTENYGGDLRTDDVVPGYQNGFKKNRAIVLKINYWLNL